MIHSPLTAKVFNNKKRKENDAISMLAHLARPPYGAISFAVISLVKAYNHGKLKIDRIQYSGYEMLYLVPHTAMATAVYEVLNNRPVTVHKLPYS
jgi:hypothetical protein